MQEISLKELREIAKYGYGYISHIYLHWTAGRYGQFFSDYHLNIDADGTIYASTLDLTERLAHTWQRNTGSIGICLCCCFDATTGNGKDTDFGPYPPTQEQLDSMAKCIAILCDELGLDIDEYTVMTHCEAAEKDDYGPSTTCERWDLWYLPDLPGEELKPGGDVIRGKALWWKDRINE